MMNVFAGNSSSVNMKFHDGRVVFFNGNNPHVLHNVSMDKFFQFCKRKGYRIWIGYPIGYKA